MFHFSLGEGQWFSKGVKAQEKLTMLVQGELKVHRTLKKKKKKIFPPILTVKERQALKSKVFKRH